MCFRIAVRSIESWILADRSAIAAALSVEEIIIPERVDELVNPKRTIIELAKRSGSREVRSDLLPRSGSGINEGPSLAGFLSEFAEHKWRPLRAAQIGNSPSLSRAVQKLRELL
jgi:hypothetical protein